MPDLSTAMPTESRIWTSERRRLGTAMGNDRSDRSPEKPFVDPTNTDVGVGPHPLPWPQDDRFDPELLESGDRRNVIDRYRYWTMDAIIADLDAMRMRLRPARLQVAIQNWQHDFNIGSIVRTANAFNADMVHIVGNRRWNRRGAMVTDRYLHVDHQPDEQALADYCASEGLTMIGVDNLPGSVPLESTSLPVACCLVFGSEGPGLTPQMVERCKKLVSISQYGSTRSLNAGAAAAITMYHWMLEHAELAKWNCE